MTKAVWSVYQIAGEVYGSKLIGHYCKPSIAYAVAIKYHLQSDDICFVGWSHDKVCLKYELSKLHNIIIADKNKRLISPIYFVKENINIDDMSCKSCTDPTCLR